MMKFLLNILLLVACASWANEQEHVQARAKMTDDESTLGLVEIDQWQVGLALGVGRRSAVVYGELDQQLFVLPDIQYYGHSFYFDNGTLGYTVYDKPNYAFSLVTEFNPIAAWFYRDHPSNWFDQQAFSSADQAPSDLGLSDSESESPSADQPEPVGPSFDNDRGSVDIPLASIDKPGWSLDAGMQLNWFFSRRHGVNVQWFTDVSGLHAGQRLELGWHFQDALTDALRWQVNAGGVWLSNAASDYYFGVRRNNTQYYEASAAWIPQFSVSLTHTLSANWSLFAYGQWQRLGSTISESPKMTESHRSTVLLGAKYVF
jgi:outer membrane protein